MLRVRRNPSGLFNGEREFSPRFKMLMFFFYFLLTFAAVRLWMYVIETDNVYYETAAAFATMLVVSTLYWYYSRLAARHRQHLENIRNGNAGSGEVDPADIEAAHLRLQLRRMFGDNLEFILQGGPGLSSEMIHRLLRQFTYESVGGREAACVKVETSEGTDLEAGAVCAETGRTSAVPFREECAVCLCDFVDGDMLTELPCGHAYHRTCITAWLLNRNLCPLCKKVAVQMQDLAAALPMALADPLPPTSPSVVPSMAHLGQNSQSSDQPSQPPAPTLAPPLALERAAALTLSPSPAPNPLPRPTVPRWRSYSGPAAPIGNLFGNPSSAPRPPLVSSQQQQQRDGAVGLEPLEDVESPRSDLSDPASMPIGLPDSAALPGSTGPSIAATGAAVSAQRDGLEPRSSQGTESTEGASIGRGSDNTVNMTGMAAPLRPGMAGYRALSINDISDLNSLEDD